ncbi:MAG: glycoside hydrolase family 13 [Trebouxia sp. A1-2]|nr:MAG: glycoside hydrolase family 13 [Trebouxia sp. A1-2]
MGLTLCGRESVPHKAGRIRQQPAVQWHPGCRNPVRAAQLRRKQTCNNQHGTVCMVAAIDAPEAQKEKHDQPQADQGPSAKHVRREEAILFQGFGWDSCKVGDWWNVVKSKIQDMKDAGFTHIWLPPPSQSVADQGYLPGQLYNLDSKYGNKEQLQELCKELKAAGIVPLADIVINHRCADEKGEDGVYNTFRDDVTHKGEKVDWGKWAITCDDPDFGGEGSPDTGDDYGPAPDLDHTNDTLRSSIVDWMKWLQHDIGFEGWRFDFVKGYGAEFMQQYCGETVGNNAFNVGEYWADLKWGDDGLEYDQNEPRQTLVDWLEKAGGCFLFDFPTKGILAEAVRHSQYWRLIDHEGRMPGLAGYWPSRSVAHSSIGLSLATKLRRRGMHTSSPTLACPASCGSTTLIMAWAGASSTWLKSGNGTASTAVSSWLSKLAEADIYVAHVSDKLVVKLALEVTLPQELCATRE